MQFSTRFANATFSTSELSATSVSRLILERKVFNPSRARIASRKLNFMWKMYDFDYLIIETQ